jgi:pimeloyl-ACP methyl ester carboxylesterase
LLATCFTALTLLCGCGGPPAGPVIFYCEGAGWYASSGSVEAGLRAAGYKGRFKNYVWGSHLGAGTDHLINARSGRVARGLSRRIEAARKADPDAPIHVMGLSAGTAVVLSALEQLAERIRVDNVVLVAPSVSARHNLRRAMRHVRGRLYATHSPHDGILRGLVVNADGLRGPAAGRTGFRMSAGADAATRAAYDRVINLPWRSGYIAYNNNGGHTEGTGALFVEAVIAPRILGDSPHPLDRSIVQRLAAEPTPP